MALLLCIPYVDVLIIYTYTHIIHTHISQGIQGYEFDTYTVHVLCYTGVFTLPHTCDVMKYNEPRIVILVAIGH